MSELVDSFGDVTGEYLALRNGCGLVEGLRVVVGVHGPDAVSFLDGLLSQDLAAMDPGDVSRALLLSPQGKLRALLWVVRNHEEVALIVDAPAETTAIEDLHKFCFRVDATITDAAAPVVELWGPGAAATLDGAGIGTGPGLRTEAGVMVVRADLGGLARFFVVGADSAALEEAGAVRVGGLAATAVRIEAGEPLMGIDVDERTIPQESGLVDEAVSFTKGCYLGQELVARIDARGRVNRHLRGIVIKENLLPPPGADLVHEDRVVGTLSSIAESLEVRAPVGLALVRREVEPGTDVAVRWPGGSVAAAVALLPLDDFSPA